MFRNSIHPSFKPIYTSNDPNKLRMNVVSNHNILITKKINDEIARYDNGQPPVADSKQTGRESQKVDNRSIAPIVLSNMKNLPEDDITNNQSATAKKSNMTELEKLASRHLSTYAAFAITAAIGAITAAVVGGMKLAKTDSSGYDEEGNNAELAAEKEFVDGERAEYLDPNTSDERRAEIASHYNETIINGQISPEFTEMTQAGKDNLATTTQAARNDAIESAREKDKNAAKILLATIGLSGLIGLLAVGKFTYNIQKNKQVKAAINGYEHNAPLLNRVDRAGYKFDEGVKHVATRNHHYQINNK